MRGYQLYNALAQLQENNNGTLDGLSYDDFVNALGSPTTYSLNQNYWTKNRNLRTGWVCSWGGERFSTSYYVEIVFDRMTNKFYHLAEEEWDKSKDDWCSSTPTHTTTTRTSTNQTNDDMSVGGTFAAILLITAVIFGIGCLIASL